MQDTDLMGQKYRVMRRMGALAFTYRIIPKLIRILRRSVVDPILTRVTVLQTVCRSECDIEVTSLVLGYLAFIRTPLSSFSSVYILQQHEHARLMVTRRGPNSFVHSASNIQ